MKMEQLSKLLLAAAVCAVLAACSTKPKVDVAKSIVGSPTAASAAAITGSAATSQSYARA